MPKFFEMTVNFTAEDLSGNCWDAKDCPGFRAIKKVVPSLDYWLFHDGVARDSNGRGFDVLVSKEVGNKLHRHANYQEGFRSSTTLEFPPEKAEPFTCVVKVPFEVANMTGV